MVWNPKKRTNASRTHLPGVPYLIVTYLCYVKIVCRCILYTHRWTAKKSCKNSWIFPFEVRDPKIYYYLSQTQPCFNKIPFHVFNNTHKILVYNIVIRPYKDPGNVIESYETLKGTLAASGAIKPYKTFSFDAGSVGKFLLRRYRNRILSYR